ncbi:MAG: peptide deformylase [Acidimicrobiales bacterium]
MSESPCANCQQIVLYGNPVLRQEAKPVTVFDETIEKLIQELFDTMYSIDIGVGLAANQIGRSESVFVFDCHDGLAAAVVNPVVETVGKELQYGWEGCLSLPGFDLETTRYEQCKVHGFDAQGQPVTYEGEGLRSRCFQHETDHLHGMIYIDRHSVRTRKKADSLMRATDWYGHMSLDPRSDMYRQAQAEED